MKLTNSLQGFKAIVTKYNGYKCMCVLKRRSHDECATGSRASAERSRGAARLPETLARRMLQQQLWMAQGKTPDQTVSAGITTHIRKYGSSSPFQRTAAGVYALRRWGLPEYLSTKPPKDRTATSTALSPSSNSNLSQPMTARQTLSFTDAAEYVLEHFGNRMPMHYRDITEKALEEGVLRTAGQTPEATLSSQIGSEITRQEQRGEEPRFVRPGKGKVSLSR